MSRRFFELYLDEDVDVVLADLLRSRGFSVTTTQQADNQGKTDSEQLAYCASHQKTLLPHNRADFELLAREYFEPDAPMQGLSSPYAAFHINSPAGF